MTEKEKVNSTIGFPVSKAGIGSPGRGEGAGGGQRGASKGRPVSVRLLLPSAALPCPAEVAALFSAVPASRARNSVFCSFAGFEKILVRLRRSNCIAQIDLTSLGREK